MDSLQIEQELKKHIQEYGPNGDESLEYYGLIVQDHVCYSTKIYRRASKNINEEALINEYKKTLFFNEIVKYAKIYDFSQRWDEQGNSFIRLVFAPYKDVVSRNESFHELISLCHLNDYETFFKNLTDYYEYTHFTGESALLKMGIELDSEGNVLESKAYFALRSFDHKCDHVGCRYPYSKIHALVDESLRLLGMREETERFNQISDCMEKNDYYPVFTGINFSKDYVEMKVYYETCLVNYDEKTILEAENSVCEVVFGDKAFLESMHADVIQNKAFLDCISFSVIKKFDGKRVELWKPYYLLLDDALIKARMLDRCCFEKHEQNEIDSDDYIEVLTVTDEDQPLYYTSLKQAEQKSLMFRCFSVILTDENGHMITRTIRSKNDEKLYAEICSGYAMTSFVIEEAEQKLFDDYAIRVHLKQLKTLKHEEKCVDGKQRFKLIHVLVGNYNCSELNLSVQTALEIIKMEELLEKIENCPECITSHFAAILSNINTNINGR